MSLGSALTVASSGLKATQTWADTTARNIANSTNEGYARKDVQFETRNGAVHVSGIRREVDTMLDRLDRRQTSELARQAAIRDGLEIYTATLGQPGDAVSLSDRMSAFREGLQSLASKPGDPALQTAAVQDAVDLAATFRKQHDMLAMVDHEVRLNIGYDVADANRALRDIARVNGELQRMQPGSIGAAEAGDTLGQLVDTVAGFMDVQTVEARDGRISVYTASGTALVEDGRVNTLAFNAGTDTLTAGGVDITPLRDGARGFDHGSLAGLFELRGEVLPQFQTQLDEGAKLLISTFQTADPTVASGGAGLFTDAQGALDPTKVDGLAGRLAVNDSVNPETGGDVRRLRDGVQATTARPAGDPTQIDAFLDAMGTPQTVDPASGVADGLSLVGFAEALVARQQTTRAEAADRHDSIAVSAEAIGATRRNGQGVNTDEELQELILVEQSYAANAKMMTTVSQMLDTLLAAF